MLDPLCRPMLQTKQSVGFCPLSETRCAPQSGGTVRRQHAALTESPTTRSIRSHDHVPYSHVYIARGGADSLAFGTRTRSVQQQQRLRRGPRRNGHHPGFPPAPCTVPAHNHGAAAEPQVGAEHPVRRPGARSRRAPRRGAADPQPVGPPELQHVLPRRPRVRMRSSPPGRSGLMCSLLRPSMRRSAAPGRTCAVLNTAACALRCFPSTD